MSERASLCDHPRQSENEWVYALSDALERAKINHSIQVQHVGTVVPPTLSIQGVARFASARALAKALAAVGADAEYAASTGWKFTRLTVDG